MKQITFVNLAVLLAFVIVFAIPPIIPTLSGELGITYEKAGLLMTAYALTRCVGSFLAGMISDRLGSIRVVRYGLLCAAVCSFLMTLGSNYGLMLAFRIAAAVGITAIFIAALDTVPKLMPREKIGTGVGYINSSVNLGIGLALATTPILAHSFGWRIVLQAYSIGCFLLWLAFFIFLKPAGRGIVQDVSHRKVESGPGIRALVAHPAVTLLATAMALLFVQIYGLITWIPPYLGDVLHFTPEQVGLGSTVLGLVAIPASVVTGMYASSFRRNVMLCVAGSLLSAGGTVALLLWHSWSLTGILAITTCIAWGMAQSVVPLMSMSSMVMRRAWSGKVLGYVFTFGYAGSIVSTYLGGFFITRSGSYDMAFAIYALAAVFSVLVVLTIGRWAARNSEKSLLTARENYV